MATTPVFLPEESHGQRSLANYSPWAHKEWDTMESLSSHAPLAKKAAGARKTTFC